MSHPACNVVLDIGKTHSKLTLWDQAGRRLAWRVRRNESLSTGAYRALDAPGIERWLATTLAYFGELGTIRHIVPVAHGAAAALIANDELLCPPMDYEQALPPELLAQYRTIRDPFALTGSPPLPCGLNLGAQLYWLERLQPAWPGPDTQLLPWAQYWAWLLSGVPASERTSLGAHTDLWRPMADSPSELAERRGWARRLAPVRGANEILGTVRPAWARRARLSADTQVLCGLHDSNAALLAARAFSEMATGEATVVSTGTWFIAMRSGATFTGAPLAAGLETRDCLLNVDIAGHPVPSARFMGGREAELLLGREDCALDAPGEQAALLQAAAACVRSGRCIVPTAVPGVGPYPTARLRWLGEPSDAQERTASVALYLAMLTHTALSLIGARERILIDGRFGGAEVFVRALAALRAPDAVYVGEGREGVARGALRLVPDQPSVASCELHRIEPLALDLAAYHAAWLAALHEAEPAAGI